MAGLVIMAGGSLLIAINVGSILWWERFYPMTLLLAGAALAGGGWVSITGRVASKNPRLPQPLWWTVGCCVVGFAGGAAGLWVSELLARK